MTLGRFLNSSRSLVSINDTGYFDPDVMTPQVCFGTALKKKKTVRKETDFSCRKKIWFYELQKLTWKKIRPVRKNSTQNGTDSG